MQVTYHATKKVFIVYVYIIADVEISPISLNDENRDDVLQLPTITGLDWLKPNDTITIYIESLKGTMNIASHFQ